MICLTCPVNTRAHSWPAGAKLFALCVFTLALFYIQSVAIHIGILAVTAALYALPGKVFLKSGLSQLRILWPFVLVIGVWHTFTGEYYEGTVITLRLLSAVAAANLVTMTSRLSEMIEVVRILSSPLRRLGLQSQSMEIAFALVIRMIPVLVQKGQIIAESWRVRTRRRLGWRILLPFALVALDDAEHVAEALKARGGLSTTSKGN